jgi:zinc protease
MPIFEREVERVKAEPVSEEELARAIARLELGTLQGLETVSGKAEAIGFNTITLGDPSGLFTKLEQFRRVTRGDVLRVARRYLVTSQRTVVEVMPSGEVDDEDDEEEDEEAA